VLPLPVYTYTQTTETGLKTQEKGKKRSFYFFTTILRKRMYMNKPAYLTLLLKLQQLTDSEFDRIELIDVERAFFLGKISETFVTCIQDIEKSKKKKKRKPVKSPRIE
jgi:hypothetical protein